MAKDDDDGPDSEKEWKSSHDRFVDALERFMAKVEKDQAKQERTANGFYIEISRKELLAHFQERVLFYSDEAFKLSEQVGQIPDEYKLPDGSPMIGADALERLDEDRRRKIARLRARSKTFEFASKHLPEGKETFLMTVEGLSTLDLVPPES